MSFHDIFRSFLGLPRYDSGSRSGGIQNDFRNPIWNVDDDDDTDDELYHDNSAAIFGDHREMHRYFESQMAEVLRSFSGMFEILEGIEPSSREGIADFNFPALNASDTEKTLRDEYLKPGYHAPEFSEGQTKADSDLDGKIASENLNELFATPQQQPSTLIPHFFGSNSPTFYGKSVTIRTITKPDGTRETQKTVRDTNGTEETTITTSSPDGNLGPLVSSSGDGLLDNHIWKNLFGN